MYPITSEVKALFDAEQRQTLRITGTDKNGTAINITEANVEAGGFDIDRYCCNGEKLEVGTAIAGQMKLRLNNRDGAFNSTVFEGTELFVEIGIADWMLNDPVVHWVPCGYFTPDTQPRRLNIIDLTCLDRMTKFDAAIDGSALTFPVTVVGLVEQVNTLCGVTLAADISALPNASVSITALPTVNGTITYRNIIQWCAGLMAANAWFDWNGQLRFTWCDTNPTYETTIENRFNSDFYEDDLAITGAVYTTSGGIEIVEGTDEYAVDLTGNELAGSIITTVLPAVNTAVNGLTYRPFTASVINAPYLWPMDAVYFMDKNSNRHLSVLTNVAFGINGPTAIESRGMTYVLNQRAQPSGITKEQAQIINEALERVENDIDDSLTQQEIFNRLTNNGEAQGMILLNGQLYVNASYLRSGIIDGDLVTVKKLNVIDDSGDIIATFDSAIQFGKEDDVNAKIDKSSFALIDQNGVKYLSFGSEEGVQIEETFVCGEDEFRTKTPVDQNSFVVVSRNGVAVRESEYSVHWQVQKTGISASIPKFYVYFWETIQETVNEDGSVTEEIGEVPPDDGDVIVVRYNSTKTIYSFDIGVRKAGTVVGKYSIVVGEECQASSMNSYAEGYLTIAGGFAAHSEGLNTETYGHNSHAEGRYTYAGGRSQHVFGEYNVKDNENAAYYGSERGQYVEIVGNGTDDNRSNARTLDWDGNEWIAGALDVGDAATTRENLGITPANIGALPSSGGTMTGDISMGQATDSVPANVISWLAADGTLFYMRPKGNKWQMVMRPSGGSSVGLLNFFSDGTISVDSPANWRSALGAAAAADVSDLIIKRSFTLTTSVSLNSLASYTYEVPYTTPSGYKAVAALEGRVNGSIFAVTVALRSNGTHCAAYVVNASSATRTGTGVTVDILFIRDV